MTPGLCPDPLDTVNEALPEKRIRLLLQQPVSKPAILGRQEKLIAAL
jgi:hypothetical protein